MEVCIRDVESETGKWRSGLVNVSVCLLTSCAIPNVIFICAPLGVVLGCVRTPNGTTLIKKLKPFWVQIPILQFNLLCREY